MRHVLHVIPHFTTRGMGCRAMEVSTRSAVAARCLRRCVRDVFSACVHSMHQPVAPCEQIIMGIDMHAFTPLDSVLQAAFRCGLGA